MDASRETSWAVTWEGIRDVIEPEKLTRLCICCLYSFSNCGGYYYMHISPEKVNNN